MIIIKQLHRSFLSVAIMVSLSASLFGQNKPEPKQEGGVNTGPALTYSSRRTTGITDPKAPVIFEDVTDKTAMANFKHRAGSAAKDYIFEVPSGGVAVFD